MGIVGSLMPDEVEEEETLEAFLVLLLGELKMGKNLKVIVTVYSVNFKYLSSFNFCKGFSMAFFRRGCLE